MSSFQWIKLYDDILDDPKMGRLSDGAFRLCVNLFLLANRQEERDGRLPCRDDITWILRLPDEDFTKWWQELEKAGIVYTTDKEIGVTSFEKRQAHVPGAERVRQHRERQAKNPPPPTPPLPEPADVTPPSEDIPEAVTPQSLHVTSGNNGSNDGVTPRYTDKEEELEEEKDREEIRASTPPTPQARNAVAAYTNEIGSLTPLIRKSMDVWIGDVGEQWVVEAIGEAAVQNKRNWAYIKAILGRWQVEGKQGKDIPRSRANGNGHHPAPAAPTETAADRAARIMKMAGEK